MFMGFLRAAALAALWTTAATAQVGSGPFSQNADGLTLSEILGSTPGSTLVGVTRDSSKTWAVYLGRDKKVSYQLANGGRRTGTWRQASRNIICLKWSDAKDSAKEDCKLADPKGRGLDWRNVGNLRMDNGVLKYTPADSTEKEGYSQIVYRYFGDVRVERNSYLPDPRMWEGRVVVGRTLKDREPWLMRLNRNRTVTFAFASGRVLLGSYTTTANTVCLTFTKDAQASGCRRPVTRSGKNLWEDAATGQAMSEIAYLSPADPPEPKAGEEAIATHSKPTTFDLVEVSADNSVAVVVESATRRLRLIEPFTGKLLALPNLLDGLWGAQDLTRISGIDVSDDGGVIAVTDRKRIAVIRRDDPAQPFAEVFIDDLWPSSTERQALDIDLSPDGSRLAIALGLPGVAMLDTRDLSLLWQGTVSSTAHEVEFSPDGRAVAAAANGGTAVTIDAVAGVQLASGLYGSLSDMAHWLEYEKTGNEAARRRLQVSDMVYSPDGTRLMIGTWGGFLATLAVGETRLSRLNEFDVDTSIRDLDSFATGEGAPPQVVLALKDAPTMFRRIDGTEPARNFGPASRSGIEADVLGASPLIVLQAAPEGGLELWTSSKIGEIRVKRYAEAAKATAADIATRYNTALRAGAASVKARTDALAEAFAQGDCARFDSFGRHAVLYQQRKKQTCAEHAAAEQKAALEKQLFVAIEAGECAAADRLWHQLGAPEKIRSDIFNRPVGEICQDMNRTRSLSMQIQQQIADGQCGGLDDLTAALVDAYFSLRLVATKQVATEAQKAESIALMQTECEKTRILDHAGAQEMLLAGVKKEAAGDIEAARKIYEALMTRHVNDPLALRAGDRMIALIDKKPAPRPGTPEPPTPKAPNSTGGGFLFPLFGLSK